VAQRLLRLGVLASFNGTNFQAIVDAVAKRKLRGVEIACLASNKPDCGAVEKARRAGVKIIIVTLAKPDGSKKTREEYDAELVKALEKEKVDLVVLAGFFRILSPVFVKAFKNRIINLHPSLLPAFKGGCSDAQRRALDWGAKVTGCTVHFVDETEDEGPIIIQKAVPIEEDDDEESLSARIREREHEALIEAIQLVADGRTKIEGRRVRVLPKNKK
jgi:phosphoribosylglycinamide formyltransferase-1